MTKVNLLIVEDNPADAELLVEHLNQSRFLTELQIVHDGQKAMDYLRGKAPFRNATSPDLVLLDLNLPRLSGHEVLAAIKSDVQLKRMPVVVLSSSQAEQDVVRSYDLQASAYIVKPFDLAGFRELVKGLEAFWLSVVRFPPVA